MAEVGLLQILKILDAASSFQWEGQSASFLSPFSLQKQSAYPAAQQWVFVCTLKNSEREIQEATSAGSPRWTNNITYIEQWASPVL